MEMKYRFEFTWFDYERRKRLWGARDVKIKHGVGDWMPVATVK